MEFNQVTVCFITCCISSVLTPFYFLVAQNQHCILVSQKYFRFLQWYLNLIALQEFEFLYFDPVLSHKLLGQGVICSLIPSVIWTTFGSHSGEVCRKCKAGTCASSSFKLCSGFFKPATCFICFEFFFIGKTVYVLDF